MCFESATVNNRFFCSYVNHALENIYIWVPNEELPITTYMWIYELKLVYIFAIE